MANKDLTIVLKTKNMLSAGLSQAQSSVKGFSDRLKGLFDIGAKPILVISAGVMALKKGIDTVEEGFRGFGRLLREQRSEELKAQFDRLRDSVSNLQKQYANSEAVFNSNNKIFDEQKKTVRALADATFDLEKAKRLASATTEEERKAIEAEYEARSIAVKSAQAQQDIIDEVARKRQEASMKEQQAIALEVKARELGKKSVEALSRASEMSAQESKLGGSFLGFATGANAKEIESLQKAKDEATNLAKQYRDEQAKVLADVSKLRMEATENIRVSAETEKGIEAEKIKAQADALELERKQNEERIKLAEETAKKLEDLKKQEVDAQANIEQNARDEQMKAWDAQLKANEEIAKKTVAQFLEDAKTKKDEEMFSKQEEKKALRLAEMEARGTKLSKRDKEFLEASRTIKQAGVQADVAKKNIEAEKLTQVLNRQNDLNNKLAEIQRKQVELSQIN